MPNQPTIPATRQRPYVCPYGLRRAGLYRRASDPRGPHTRFSGPPYRTIDTRPIIPEFRYRKFPSPNRHRTGQIYFAPNFTTPKPDSPTSKFHYSQARFATLEIPPLSEIWQEVILRRSSGRGRSVNQSPAQAGVGRAASTAGTTLGSPRPRGGNLRFQTVWPGGNEGVGVLAKGME